LRTALSKISRQYREILALKYEANLNYDQIAETLGLSQANVEKRLYRARQALLALMPELGERPIPPES
jgi:RNA polymerase sigma factor (sigma-70 family)